MTIQELREKRSKAWDTARDFLDSKRNESGLLSEEDSKTYDAMEAILCRTSLKERSFLHLKRKMYSVLLQRKFRHQVETAKSP